MDIGEWYFEKIPSFIGRSFRCVAIILGYISMIPFILAGAIAATITIGYIAAYRETYIFWLTSPLTKK